MFLKKLFSEQYSKQTASEPSLGRKIEEVNNIQFRLRTFKLLHAKQQLEIYNQMTSEEDAEIFVNGWKASGI